MVMLIDNVVLQSAETGKGHRVGMVILSEHQQYNEWEACYTSLFSRDCVKGLPGGAGARVPFVSRFKPSVTEL